LPEFKGIWEAGDKEEENGNNKIEVETIFNKIYINF